MAGDMSFIEHSLIFLPSWMLKLTSKSSEKILETPCLSAQFPVSTHKQFDRIPTTRNHKSTVGTTICTLLILISLVITQFSRCSAQKTIFKSHPTSIVIPHIKYGQGLNRWSFLSVDRDNHGLHSDLLCPNPIIGSPGSVSSKAKSGNGGNRMNSEGGGGGGSGRRGNQRQQSQQQNKAQLLPNEIWAVKTEESVSLVPCSLRQYAVPSPPFNANNNGNHNLMMINSAAGGTRHNNGHYIENRLLFFNVSLTPFNFRGSTPCSKYIKLMYDEEEGTNLKCRDIPFDNKFDNKYHIYWPENHSRRKEYFSLLENLERFLQDEHFYRQFYFQIFFTSFNGRTKRCTVQQYELDLSYPAGNARFCNLTQNAGYDELCGEFPCDDSIFPMFIDPQPHTGHNNGKHNRARSGHDTDEDDDDPSYDDDEDYGDEDASHEHDPNFKTHHHNKHAKEAGDGRDTDNSLSSSHTRDSDKHQPVGDDSNHSATSWTRMLRLDMRLLIFVTIVPLVLFGILIFGLELIVYFMCCRKRRGEDIEGDRDRSQQLLQNSLNVWENVPSRDAQRTVSFSPMTTNIYAERKNMMMDTTSLQDHPETPKILKSALKKSGEHSSPTTAAAHNFFEYDHDMPPSYIETTTR